MHYRNCHFTEDFNEKKLILGKLICQKIVLLLNLFCIKGQLKLHYEIKILLLLVNFCLQHFGNIFSLMNDLLKPHV